MSSGGVTTKIRLKLNFHDEQLWKRFSARRLKLIEENQMYAQKASDQDEKIQNISESLRVEFDLSEDHIDDINKLVRAAVQSIRRNRKRSSKSRKSGDNNFIIISNTFSLKNKLLQPKNTFQGKVNGSKVTTRALSSEPNDSDSSNDSTDHTSQKAIPEPKKRQNSSHEKLNDAFIDDIMHVEGLKSTEGDVVEVNHLYSKKQKISQNDLSKIAISSFVRPVIDDGEKAHIANGSHDKRRNGSESKAANNSMLISSIRVKALHAKKSLLNIIKKSKTCSLSTQTGLIIKKDSNIYHLGKATVPSIILFLLCKSFPNDYTDQESFIEYLRIKLNSPEVIAKILKSLDYESPDVNLMTDEIAVNTLYYILGCCINDFQFNEIAELMSNIFYEVIADDFPMVLMNKNFIFADIGGGVDTVSKANGIYNTNSDEVKKVEIRFKDECLEFTFDSSTAAAPTILEVLVNCKKAFKIYSESKILALLNNGKVINNDFELEAVFHRDKKIVIELCFLKDLTESQRHLSKYFILQSVNLESILHETETCSMNKVSPSPSESSQQNSSQITPPVSADEASKKRANSGDLVKKTYNLTISDSFTLGNPYQISSIQSYARSSNRPTKEPHELDKKEYIPPRFERLL